MLDFFSNSHFTIELSNKVEKNETEETKMWPH